MRVCRVPGCPEQHKAKGWCGMHYARASRHGDPLVVSRIRRAGTAEDRFWASISKTETCWVWTHRTYSNGYGVHRVNGRGVLAHRYMYALVNGAIPTSAQIDHTCRNRACVNPAHLRLATNKQNSENIRVRSDSRWGFRGVGLNPQTGKFRARVTHNKREYYAGEYATPEEAGEAARQLRLDLFTHNIDDRSEVQEPA